MRFCFVFWGGEGLGGEINCTVWCCKGGIFSLAMIKMTQVPKGHKVIKTSLETDFCGEPLCVCSEPLGVLKGP